MKVNYLTRIAAATILLLSASALRAENNLAGEALAAEAKAAPAATPAQTAPAPANYRTDTVDYCQDCDMVRDFIVRAGVWGVHATGSPRMVGEYQDLKDSAFADIDGIFSDAERTVDFNLTSNDNETSNGRLYYYGPNVSANIEYDRFLHRLDTHNFAGWNYNGNNTVGPLTSGTTSVDRQSIVVYSNDDRAPGQDFVIRVQEFKANFKGNITDNLKWRVNVFGLDKQGERQVNSFAHCSTGGTANTVWNGTSVINPNTGLQNSQLTGQCHSIARSQRIEWQTTEVTPSLELRIGCNSTLEYSHLIREFKQFDSAVVYGYFGNSGTSLDPTDNTPSSTAGFAIVPNGETQIDRLKFASKIGCDTDMYVLGYLGYNRNQLRNTSRDFNGADLRITNSSLDNLTLTGYGKYYREETSDPTVALNTAYPAQAKFYREANLNGLAEQVNREVHAVGVDGRWRPFQDECGTFRSRMAIVGGYEYSTLMREHAEYEMAAQGSGPFVVSRGTAGSTFHQPNSNRNAFVVGVEENWSCAFTTYLRYKYIATEYPLYAVTHEAATSIDASLGSNLPTQENRVEVGATWTPTDNLMVNATLYLENAMSDAPYVNWTSNTLPFVVSAWYAPTECWSITGGAAVMEGWINQEVTLAQLRLAQPVQTAAAVDLPWQYTSSSDVFNVGTRYMATEKLAFSGDFEYVRGLNSSYAVVNPALSTPVVPGAPGNGPAPPYEIGQYSLVRMESYRLGAGVDYLWRPRVTTFLRYNYYDYRDLSLGVTSGQAHMFLGGMSALF